MKILPVKKQNLLRISFSVVYCILLFIVLFWNPFRENIYSGISREYYIERYCNFRPFHTVLLYVNAYRNGTLKVVSFFNLVGNLLLFAPVPFLIPKNIRAGIKWYLYLPISISIPCLAEAVQFLLMAGSCDVDDCILNFIGFVFSFIFLQILDKNKKMLYNGQKARRKIKWFYH